MLGKRVSGNQFFKIFCERARGLRAFGARGRPAPPAAAPRTPTQSCRESMPVPTTQKSIPPYACAWTGLTAAELNCELQPINFATLTRMTNNVSCNWVDLFKSVQFSSCGVNTP